MLYRHIHQVVGAQCNGIGPFAVLAGRSGRWASVTGPSSHVTDWRGCQRTTGQSFFHWWVATGAYALIGKRRAVGLAILKPPVSCFLGPRQVPLYWQLDGTNPRIIPSNSRRSAPPKQFFPPWKVNPRSIRPKAGQGEGGGPGGKKWPSQIMAFQQGFRGPAGNENKLMFE